MEKIIKFYKDFLGIDLNNLQHPIAEKIASLSMSSSSIDKKIKQYHLQILGISLMEIRNYNENIYNHYLSKIVNNKDISVHGRFFEINQCAHFIRISQEKKLNFEFGEANNDEPDFIVNKFGFEITSSRFADEANMTNPGRKLLSKFREKNRKSYANSNCVLLVDINQMSYHTIVNGKPVSPTFEEVREMIRNESKFGVVILLMEWIEKTDTIHFKPTAYTEYNENCTLGLKQMVEQKFMFEKNIFEGQILISPN